MKKNYGAEKIWQFDALEKLACLTVFIVPLYVNYRHWFFDTTKALLFIGLTSVMLLLYIFGKLREKESVYKITSLHVVLAIFFTVLTISALFGYDKHLSFFGTFTGTQSLFLFYFIGIFACLVGFLINRNKRFLPTLLSVAFVASVIITCITYGGPSALKRSNDGSTLGSSSYLGAYLLLTVSFGIGLFFWYQKRWQRLLVGTGLLAICISPVFFSRKIWNGKIAFSQALQHPTLFAGSANGAELGLILAIFVMVLVIFTRSHKKIVAWSASTFFVLCTVGLFMTGLSFSHPESRLHQTFAEEKGENRFVFWDIAKEGYNEKPLFGYGYGNYTYLYQNHFDSSVLNKGNRAELWVNHPHNMFMEYLATSGVVGLVAYLLLIGFLFVSLYKIIGSEDKMKRIFATVLAGAVFGYVFQNMFVFDTTVPLIMFFLTIGIAIGFSRHIYSIRHTLAKGIVVVCGMGIFAFGFIFLTVIPWSESRHWALYTAKVDIKRLPEGNPQHISLLGDIEDTAYAADQILSGFEKTSPDFIAANKLDVIRGIDKIVADVENEQKGNPPDFRAQLAMGKFLNLRLSVTRDRDPETISRAKNYFSRAIEINPGNPLAYLNIAATYALEGNVSNMYSYLRAAIAIAPQYEKSYSFARNLLAQAPDKNFQKYIDTMEARWQPMSDY